MIEDKKLQIYFFFILFGIVSILTFLVYQPFFQVIALAVIFAVILNPFYKKILSLFGGRKGLSATFVLLVMLVFIATPLYFLVGQVFNESQTLYASLQGNETDFVAKFTAAVERPVRDVYPNFSLNLGTRLSSFAELVSQNIGQLVSGTAFAVFEIFIVLVSLFFFLRDGERFISAIIKISPLDEQYDKEIFDKMQKTIHSVLRGALFIALIQGLLVGLGLFIFGVPNAALWSSFAAITALVPGVGTAIVIIPCVLYLTLIGSNAAALGVLLWGMLLVGLVDNVLAPIFYSKGIEVHQLFVFFAVLGGIAFFGPFGFLFGPVILSAFLALLHIYRIFILDEKEGDEVKS
jgi:predicted PurR-regulated permease PerM